MKKEMQIHNSCRFNFWKIIFFGIKSTQFFSWPDSLTNEAITGLKNHNWSRGLKNKSNSHILSSESIWVSGGSVKFALFQSISSVYDVVAKLIFGMTNFRILHEEMAFLSYGSRTSCSPSSSSSISSSSPQSIFYCSFSALTASSSYFSSLWDWRILIIVAVACDGLVLLYIVTILEEDPLPSVNSLVPTSSTKMFLFSAT